MAIIFFSRILLQTSSCGGGEGGQGVGDCPDMLDAASGLCGPQTFNPSLVLFFLSFFLPLKGWSKAHVNVSRTEAFYDARSSASSMGRASGEVGCQLSLNILIRQSNLFNKICSFFHQPSSPYNIHLRCSHQKNSCWEAIGGWERISG